LVYAKTKNFLSLFNRLLAERGVQKIYRAVVEGQKLTTGLYQHSMEPSPRAPKTVVEESRPGWQECRLQILSVKNIDDFTAQSLEIELLTGRTHQIRAQLSALNAPIRGDVLYGAKPFFAGEEIDLTADKLSFLDHRFSL
jgi:23S rRNA pseudouridine1911/1915/1917 synthase